ncbi:SIR2 family NAD-dependent protein deacylase [Deinococcus altitudinis]|uniref:SIR2 family NAD-dependent protein deacylase n=1 Tax=Deinococcus altitudinis TaxID=468914 RepID=UPI0038920848
MNLQEAAALLHSARRVVVMTGAGVSAESGIPTFRDAQTGHWARFRPEDLASPEAYWRDPVTVWDWYAGRYRDVTAASPNRGHELLAELERRKLAEYGEGAFTLVTQNVDGLHLRAGSRPPLELHGNLTHGRCESCEHLQPLPEAASFTPPPTCEVCGSRMRPNVVWFGEMLPEDVLEDAQFAFERAEVAIVIGTSGQVYPAAALADVTLQRGGAVIEINPDTTPLTPRASFSLRATASEGLTALMAES